jgi:hypothetical protein
MRDQLLKQLKSKYETEIEIAKTNIEMFLASPQGVAEHIEYSQTVEKELEKISRANDMLEALARL